MPAKRPTGARSETVQCEFCGEYYAVTYKRCPFCDGRPARRRAEEYDDEPTRIFRHPQVEEEYEEVPVRRSKRDEQDEYEETPLRRRAPRDEYEPDDEYEDDEYDEDDDYDDSPRRGDGGRRLITNERGGGYRRRGPSVLQIIGGVLSVALIAAAIYIVVLLVGSLLGNSQPNVPATNSPTASVTPTPSDTSTPSPTESDEPTVTDEPTDPTSTTIPAGQTATAFTLTNSSGKRLQDITLSEQYPDYKFVVAFSPSGSTGSITWSSSKPEVVSVDQSGKVVGVSKGVATITATMAGGYAQQCMVRSSVTSSGSGSAQPSTSPSVSPSSSASSGGKLSFNVSSGDEFTLTGVGDSWTLNVKNAKGTPTWSVKDSSIATVDANGKVTAVSKGSTTVTATVDGQTLNCLVRVNIP
ncbi:Bacterial group 2 Ig-like protein [uncultured Eubacteriales bacterium]|uniref:Bacterial group 2 Ig-like protein n=1 Tax=uncultured Eubacteriales bacterium TaxID=172733 RepID=A0A212J086_9FIRM|nr:Bacterial group 2 Ig-like protein [uncultured Eubacteriales bacterium]